MLGNNRCSFQSAVLKITRTVVSAKKCIIFQNSYNNSNFFLLNIPYSHNLSTKKNSYNNSDLFKSYTVNMYNVFLTIRIWPQFKFLYIIYPAQSESGHKETESYTLRGVHCHFTSHGSLLNISLDACVIFFCHILYSF